MEIVAILFWKILNMFCVMGLGAYLYRKKIISDATTEELGKLLIRVVLPSLVLSQIWTEYSREKQESMIRCFLLCIMAWVLVLVIARLRYFRKEDAVNRGCSAFPNVGFFGVPVVTAVMGTAAVFFISPTVGMGNVLMTTVLVIWISSADDIDLKNVIINPAVFALAAGMLLFFLKIPKPGFISELLNTVNALNTPVALILSGAFVARSDLIGALRKIKVWQVTLWRLILIPAAVLLLFRLLPFGTAEEKKAIWITFACPIGMNLPVYARLYGGNDDDVSLAAEEVCITTLLSLITIPLGMVAAEMIIG